MFGRSIRPLQRRHAADATGSRPPPPAASPRLRSWRRVSRRRHAPHDVHGFLSRRVGRVVCPPRSLAARSRRISPSNVSRLDRIDHRTRVTSRSDLANNPISMNGRGLVARPLRRRSRRRAHDRRLLPASRGGFVWDDGGADHEAARHARRVVRRRRRVRARRDRGRRRRLLSARHDRDASSPTPSSAASTPRTFHRTNVVLHGLNVALIVLAPRRSTAASLWAAGARRAALRPAPASSAKPSR